MTGKAEGQQDLQRIDSAFTSLRRTNPSRGLVQNEKHVGMAVSIGYISWSDEARRRKRQLTFDRFRWCVHACVVEDSVHPTCNIIV
jgi:hypothetical protein